MKQFTISALFVILAFTSTNAIAQQNKTFAKRISVEAGAGFLVPLSPDNGLSKSDFAGFRNFNVAANYALTNLWGLRLSYANNGFQDENDSSMGVTFHKLMVEGTFNIAEWIEMQRNPIEVVAHAGAGVSFAKSKLNSDIDKMGSIQVGLMPLYRVTKNVSIHLDVAYVINLKQNYGYNGMQTNLDDGHVSGEYFSLGVGVGVVF